MANVTFVQTANQWIPHRSCSCISLTPKIQLSKFSRAIDPADVTPDTHRNYLQSPYFFMVVNLQDADLGRPGQLAAAHQGEALDTATQSALAGTLVSSLHRLKDVDNTGE